MQESVAEREVSWGIMKLRVDWGHAIDVGEVARGMGVLGGMSCIFST